MEFLKRNRDELVVQLLSVVVLGAMLSFAFFLLEQTREDARSKRAEQLAKDQFASAQLIANEGYAREVSASYSNTYSFDAMDLSGTNLRSLRLTPCSEAQVVDGSSCASFIQADLSHATISLADLTGANLTGADLSYALMGDTTLSYSVAPSLNMHCAGAVAASFTQGKFQYADFTKALLELSNFREADLSHADFRGADVSLAQFDGATLEGTEWQGAWYRAGSQPGGLPDDIIEQLEARDDLEYSCKT